MLSAGLTAAPAIAASPAWRTLAVTGPTNLPPVSDEIQRVVVDAAGGTFSLEFESQSTAPLAFDLSPGDLASALKQLASIGGAGGEVSVNGGPGGPGGATPYYVRFGGTMAGTDVAAIVVDGSSLAGAGASATAGTESEGGGPGSGQIAIEPTNVGGAPSNGSPVVATFTLPAGITATTTAECTVVAQDVTCTRTAVAVPGEMLPSFSIPVSTGPSAPPNAIVPVTVEGGGAAPHTYEMAVVVSKAPAPVGVQALWAGAFDENGVPFTQAGGHPGSAGLAFRVNTIYSPSGGIIPAGDPRDLVIDLPPGFVGNPLVTDRCPQDSLTECAAATAVGRVRSVLQSFKGAGTGTEQLSNAEAAPGFAAQFTFELLEATASSVATLRSDGDFGVSMVAPNVPTLYKVYGAAPMLEGVPATAGGKAFLTNPTGCASEAANPPTTTVATDSWQVPGVFGSMTVDIPPVTGCAGLAGLFQPDFEFLPEAQAAATGTAAEAKLTVDQSGLTDPNQRATPHLKESVVTLPQGIVLNPSAANGMEACTTAQIGLMGTDFPEPNPIRFNKSPASCPDASKIGTAQIATPLLDDPLNGTVYLAKQIDNPFKSLLAMYIVIEDARTGIVVKLPGQVTPDQQTGQLTAAFDNNPQVPFEDLTLKFRGGGPRSTLATPDVCGKYTTNGTFTPWSAPESGPPAQTTDSFEITTGVGGSLACPQTKAQRPFDLGFEAGSTQAVAGAHSPFTLRITRPDGSQELDQVSVVTPPGFAATLKGVPVCGDAQIAQAISRNKPGDGQVELDSPSCPASSQVGTTTIGAGVGSEPFYLRTGKVFLTGPYKNAKQSLTFIVPIVAGPFDLGVQVVRTALIVNPVTAQITAQSDPIPQILQGIPVQIREIRVDVDRPGFTINPTNCEPMAIRGQVTGGSGAVASLSNRFQVDGCQNLGFKPRLKLQYRGQTKRTGNPALRAVLTQPEGAHANIARTVVLLPQGSFIDNDHIGNPCTRAQYAAGACPKGSILGSVRAWSPLLEQPLSGPVIFRSNGGERNLPDIVAVLNGEVNVELVGWIDAVENRKNGTSRVRNTFALVPDAPVSRFELNMKGGRLGLIENSRDLCRGKNRATVTMLAQNGRKLKATPTVQVSCGKKKRDKGKKRVQR